MKSILILLLSAFWIGGYAQEAEPTKKVIQLTGVIFTADSSNIVPGVHVYVPDGGRGTTSNPYGFFSMPVLEGDSLIFSSVGFDRSYYIVPAHKEEYSLKLLMYLNDDVTYLEEVEIFPYPSEATFKAAVLATQLPNQQDIDYIDRWANSETMALMARNLPNSPNMNHRYFMQQQLNANNRRYQVQQNPLLNPFAWASFIRSLRSR